MRSIVLVALCGIGLMACAGTSAPSDRAQRADALDAAEVERGADATDVAAADAGSRTASATDAAPEATKAAPADEPIDLLHGVRTDLAVSSVYHNQKSQAESLVDGDLETAWNSRTGDLAGAWIEVRLPADVAVSSLALTVGFTKTKGDSDLFTGNHRIAKLRVLRDGAELGVYPLDTESRALQTLPIEGGGGVYRLEVAELRPGSNPRWREVCVSELRIEGRATAARPGERLPRLAVGALPPPRPEPGATDRAQVERLFKQRVQWFVREWEGADQESLQYSYASAHDETEPRPEQEAARLRRERELIRRGVAELVDLVDEVQADRIRLGSPREADASRELAGLATADLDLVAAGFEAVAGWLGDDAARCRWAKAHLGVRLLRVAISTGNQAAFCDQSVAEESVGLDQAENEGDATASARRELREMRAECSALQTAAERLEPFVYELEPDGYPSGSTARAIAARLGRLRVPEGSVRPRADWDALQAQLAIARRACGWE